MRDYARAGTNAYICLYVHACTCMNEYVYAYMNVRMMRAYECVQAHMCLSVSLFVFLSVCKYVCIYVCICVSIYACMCVRASVYIRMSVTFFYNL